MPEDILHTTIDGDVMSAEGCEGNVWLIVNVASRCDLTSQYKQFENIYEMFNKSGSNALGLSCNQFLGLEPDNDAAMTYGIAFPVFCKININGEHLHPRYQKLIAAASENVVPEKSVFYQRMVSKELAPHDAGDTFWNFEKFLIGCNVSVRPRFLPYMTPDYPIVMDATKPALAKQCLH